MKSRLSRILIGTLLAVLSVSVAQGVGSTAAQPQVTEPQVPSEALPAAPLAEAEPVEIDPLMASAEAAGISPDVLKLALTAVTCAVSSGEIAPPPTLTVIDYSRPSVEPRLWVFDFGSGKLLYKELVAHGRNTGENFATAFSDTLNSRQSSIGLFVTGDTYVGSNGYSLRLDGLEPGFNAHARERAIVMHGAPYVSEELAERQGRLGRSWGCPALREAVARKVIDTVRDGSVVFSYYPDAKWLKTSRFINGCGATATVVAGD